MIRGWFVVALCAALNIAGCAIHTKAAPALGIDLSERRTQDVYRGRISLKIDAADAQALGPPQGQFFSAGFELKGDAQSGELTLSSPLGGIVAALSWTPATAQLSTNGETRRFESLDALIRQATGAAIPIPSLFAWLSGQDIQTVGWRADLSRFADGRVVARRTDPVPTAELRVVLER